MHIWNYVFVYSRTTQPRIIGPQQHQQSTMEQWMQMYEVLINLPHLKVLRHQDGLAFFWPVV